ncbi:MAG: sensor histidine kinase [Microbacter sp.]
MKRKLFFYYLLLFLTFAIAVLAFQYHREKRYKANSLDTILNDTNEMVYHYLSLHHDSLIRLDSLIALFPYKDQRITVIRPNGQVIYDNVVSHVEQMENHLMRPEIIMATHKGNGSDIRTSKTTGRRYYYHASRFNGYYVRSALPYNVTVMSLLSPDNLYFYFWIMLIFLVTAFLFYFSNRFNAQMIQSQSERDAAIRRKLTHQIAHELKTPLSSVIGYMETLYDNPDLPSDKQQFFIQRSYAQAQRLNQLLQDILLLNELNEAPQTIEMELICINPLIEQVLQDVSLKLEQKQMKAHVAVEKEIWIHANSMLVYSIFRNLLDNAIAYAGEHATVTIGLSGENATHYHFVFFDNGIGVDSEHLSHLFDRFYRVDKGRSRKTGGTGLGLSIVKNAVELHSGSISVKNRQEGGLEFHFSLHK